MFMKFKKLFKSSEAKERKKQFIVLQAANWIWLGVLLFFSICAVIFEAPWKLKCILIIFLLACTVLPLKYRKWFWAAVGAVIIGCIVWVLLPNGEGWEPYSYEFTEEIEAINSRYDIADEDNAATIYNSICEDHTLKDLKPSNINRRIYQSTQQNLWSSSEHPKLFEWLKGKEEVISRYIEGSRKGRCHFPIKSEDIALFSMKIGREHVPVLSRISRMVLCSANNDLGEGRIEEGLEKQLSVLRVSEYLRAHPVDYDVLAGISIQGSALNSIQTYVINNEPVESYLESIEAGLASIVYDWADTWKRIEASKQLQRTNYLHWLLYEENPKGKVRIKIQNYIFFGNVIEWKELSYWPKRIAKAQNIIVWFFVPSNPAKIKDIVAESIQDYGLIEEFSPGRRSGKRVPSFAQEKLNLGCFINWNMNSHVFYLYELFMHLQTELRASRLMIALRRYNNREGHWPRRLEELRGPGAEDISNDPVNGGEYVYKPDDKDFILYSKGLNKIDDDGYHYRRDPGKGDCDDWWIWPPRR
jgi:hypothetical protein